ncbi:MAG TPA: hypothetical protein VFG28_09955 [Syntrophales bacterium]|nr:hypothetical protein [Syntrophales bacterium]
MNHRNSFHPVTQRIVLCFALFSLTLCPVHAAGIEAESIEASATADIQNGNLAQARDQAISLALRGAVEKVLHAAVPQPVPAARKAVIHDKIYPVTERYILNYRIVREAEQEGSYLVHVVATVDAGSLRADLRSLGVLGGQAETKGAAGSAITLVIQGTFASHHDLLAFREMLAATPPVRNVVIRFLSPGRSEMTLESGENAQVVARELAKRRFKGMPLRVLQVDAASILIAMNHQGVSRD